MKLVILGAGGYGRTIADIASEIGIYDEIVFLDDGKSGENIIGKCSDAERFIEPGTEFYPAFGINQIRYEWIVKLAEMHAEIATLIHPSAWVSKTAVIGKGSVILPNATVGTKAVLCYGCIINIGAIVDHDSVLGNATHVAPGAIVKGNNIIGAFTKVESGTVIETGTYPVVQAEV